MVVSSYISVVILESGPRFLWAHILVDHVGATVAVSMSTHTLLPQECLEARDTSNFEPPLHMSWACQQHWSTAHRRQCTAMLALVTLETLEQRVNQWQPPLLSPPGVVAHLVMPSNLP